MIFVRLFENFKNMRKFIVCMLLVVTCTSCEEFFMEKVYFHKTNLELDFNLNPPDVDGGCDCFIYFVNNYQMIIDYIVITYEIQNEKGEPVPDYRTGLSVNQIKLRSIEPFYVGEDYWKVVSDMVYNSTAKFLKILDIEIKFLK